jgi:hypothetical protein
VREQRDHCFGRFYDTSTSSPAFDAIGVEDVSESLGESRALIGVDLSVGVATSEN